MNYIFLTGVVCSVPKVTLVPMTGREPVYTCKLVVASLEINSETGKKDYNFFECIAFEDTAKKINDCYYKGAKINLFGRVRNFRFKDNNNSPHFTQIVLVEHVDFGESKSSQKNGKEKTKDGMIYDFPIIADLKEMNDLFEKICDAGFLCVDERDYFNIASDNMDIIG